MKFKAAVAIGAIGLVGGVAIAVVPAFHSHPLELDDLGARMAQGPKSTEEAQDMKAQLDAALMTYLTKHGDLPAADLLTKLQSELPTSTFEVLVFDLPHRIKLVEVDCVLQPSDYLIVKSADGPKPYRLSGLGVFDEARLIKDKAGPYLALLGHTSGGGPSSPQVRVLSLLPNSNISDRTEKLSPPVKGEGTAKFVGNTSDIQLCRGVFSTARGERLFQGDSPVDEANFNTRLKWTNGRYEADQSFGKSKVAALYSVAASLVEPSDVRDYGSYLARNVRKTIEKLTDNPVPPAPGFKIVKTAESTGRSRHRSSSDSYRLDTSDRSFEVSLVKAGRHTPIWTVTGLKEIEPPKIAADSEAKESSSAAGAISQESKKKPEPIATAQEKKKDDRSEKKQIAAKHDKSSQKTAPEKKEPPRKKETVASAPVKETSQKDKAAASKNDKVKIAVKGTPAKIASGLSSSLVQVRSGPGTGYSSITRMPRGADVKVIGKKDGWYKVAADGKQGYVYAGLVDYEKSDAYTTAVVRKKKAVKDASGHSSLSTATPGDKLVIVGGLQGDKYKVRLASGKVGYVDKDAIDVAIEEPTFVP